MRTLAAAFAVLTLAAPAQAAARLFEETEHVTRTIPMEPGGTLRLKNFSGRVTITASDRPEVVIDAVRGLPAEAAEPLASAQEINKSVSQLKYLLLPSFRPASSLA